MTALQFTLIFVALLVAIALVLLRLVRLEARFVDVARLGRIEERLAAVVQLLERARLEPIETTVKEIRGDLRAAVEGLERVERAVPRVIHTAPVTQSTSVERLESVPASERLAALVASHLESLGYQQIRILDDLDDRTLADDIEVRVECVNLGMPCKGRVALRDGAVRDAQLQSLASIFP